MDIVREREELFDEDFKSKTNDIKRIYEFCTELTRISNILVGNRYGQMYEYLPRVYRGVKRQLEVQNMQH